MPGSAADRRRAVKSRVGLVAAEAGGADAVVRAGKAAVAATAAPLVTVAVAVGVGVGETETIEGAPGGCGAYGGALGSIAKSCRPRSPFAAGDALPAASFTSVGTGVVAAVIRERRGQRGYKSVLHVSERCGGQKGSSRRFAQSSSDARVNTTAAPKSSAKSIVGELPTRARAVPQDDSKGNQWLREDLCAATDKIGRDARRVCVLCVRVRLRLREECAFRRDNSLVCVTVLGVQRLLSGRRLYLV